MAARLRNVVPDPGTLSINRGNYQLWTLLFILLTYFVYSSSIPNKWSPSRPEKGTGAYKYSQRKEHHSLGTERRRYREESFLELSSAGNYYEYNCAKHEVLGTPRPLELDS